MLRPALDGLRIQLNFVNGSEIYLVDRGQARHIATPEVYNGMFRDWTGIWELTVQHDFIEFGPSIKNPIPLFRWNEAYYLDDEAFFDQRRPLVRHIETPQTMQRYHFRSDVLSPSADPRNYPPLGPSIRWVPRFDGNRVKQPNAPEIYLIDRGTKRRIPDPDTYRRLFGNAPPQSIDRVDDIPSGHDVSANTHLVRVRDRGAVYLLEGGYKRLVADQTAMAYYGFAAGTVQPVWAGDIVELIEAPAISWPLDDSG